MSGFCDLFLPDRVRILLEDKNPEHIYELLNKHLHRSIDDLKSTYAVRLDFVMKRVFINSQDYTAIYELFEYMNKLGMKYESISQFELRIDLHVFLNTIK